MKSRCAGVIEGKQGQQIEVKSVSTESWMWNSKNYDTVWLRVG